MDEFALLVANFEAQPVSLQHHHAPSTARAVRVPAMAKEDALWRELPTAAQVVAADEGASLVRKYPHNRTAKRDVAAAVATLRRARAEAEVARIVRRAREIRAARLRARSPPAAIDRVHCKRSSMRRSLLDRSRIAPLAPPSPPRHAGAFTSVFDDAALEVLTKSALDADGTVPSPAMVLTSAASVVSSRREPAVGSVSGGGAESVAVAVADTAAGANAAAVLAAKQDPAPAPAAATASRRGGITTRSTDARNWTHMSADSMEGTLRGSQIMESFQERTLRESRAEADTALDSFAVHAARTVRRAPRRGNGQVSAVAAPPPHLGVRSPTPAIKSASAPASAPASVSLPAPAFRGDVAEDSLGDSQRLQALTGRMRMRLEELDASPEAPTVLSTSALAATLVRPAAVNAVAAVQCTPAPVPDVTVDAVLPVVGGGGGGRTAIACGNVNAEAGGEPAEAATDTAAADKGWAAAVDLGQGRTVNEARAMRIEQHFAQGLVGRAFAAAGAGVVGTVDLCQKTTARVRSALAHRGFCSEALRHDAALAMHDDTRRFLILVRLNANGLAIGARGLYYALNDRGGCGAGALALPRFTRVAGGGPTIIATRVANFYVWRSSGKVMEALTGGFGPSAHAFSVAR